MRDVRGIGFQTADRIAADLGVARDAPERVRAGVRYVLAEASDDGHVFVPMEDLVRRVQGLLEVDDGQVLSWQWFDFWEIQRRWGKP